MHCALKIHEIISIICEHSSSRDLFALARTCRTFKEPALDVLWRHLLCLSPLAQCVPEACQLMGPSLLGQAYSFSRPITRTEWDVLQTYTRRIWSLRDIGNGLSTKCIAMLSNPPTAEPVFPNLRHLRFCCMTFKAAYLLCLPLPSLTSLTVNFGSHWIESPLRLFPESCPNLKRLKLRSPNNPGDALNKYVSDCIRQWRNLQSVECDVINLDADAIMHLLQLPAVNRLKIMLNTNLPITSPLLLSDLHDLILRSQSREHISHLLSWVRLPALTIFIFSVRSQYSRQELFSVFDTLQTSGAGDTINTLAMEFLSPILGDDPPVFGLQDLRPFTAFTRLCEVVIDTMCKVDLNDDDVLTLASAWPRLERLSINKDTGWKTQGGITPNGFIRLLRTCLSLRSLALVVDTRDYAHFPPPLESPQLLVDVVDSVIEQEAVLVTKAFFGRIRYLSAWTNEELVKWPGREVYCKRWRIVCGRPSCVDDA